MSDPLPAPPKGAMYLFDYVTPPLAPDKYRIEAKTEVAFDGGTNSLPEARFFEVVGPRFALPPQDVAGVFPPRNGHGPFQDSLTQIAIKRRTLPWERKLDKTNRIGNPAGGNLLPPDYPVPWVALLLFEETEYSLLQSAPLENVVPAAVFNRLGRPANVLCDAVEADRSLVLSIMPSKEELQLLAHLRWVNIDDRELNVEGSDGWFAVVMTNRVPTPGKKCRACLVSVEERDDLVKADPPPDFDPSSISPGLSPDPRGIQANQLGQIHVIEGPVDSLIGHLVVPAPTSVRLVLLHSWQFTCEGDGTFFDLMQRLDVGMIGKVKQEGKPALTDTAHLRLETTDRGGTNEVVWYRGPLVPFELTRDSLGPYHDADQARRASPETGAEDVSYACAFEVGRLLTAADPRLAQELMRWRRGAYRQSGRRNNIVRLEGEIPLDLPSALAEKLHTALVPIIAASAMGRFVKGAGPIADRYGIDVASKAVGLRPDAVQAAWKLATVIEAQGLLGGDPGTLGLVTPSPSLTTRGAVTIQQVADNPASLEHLNTARGRLLENVKVQLRLPVFEEPG